MQTKTHKKQNTKIMQPVDQQQTNNNKHTTRQTVKNKQTNKQENQRAATKTDKNNRNLFPGSEGPMRTAAKDSQ